MLYLTMAGCNKNHAKPPEAWRFCMPLTGFGLKSWRNQMWKIWVAKTIMVRGRKKDTRQETSRKDIHIYIIYIHCVWHYIWWCGLEMNVWIWIPIGGNIHWPIRSTSIEFWGLSMNNGKWSVNWLHMGVSLNVGAQLLKWWGSPTNHGFSY